MERAAISLSPSPSCAVRGCRLMAASSVANVVSRCGSAAPVGWVSREGLELETTAPSKRKLNQNSGSRPGRRLNGRKARGTGCNYMFHKGIIPPVRCHKMFVPGFGEKSPEAKAADSLHNFFTFVAVKIVLSQLQDYNREGYEELMDFVDRVSLKDGDKFCATLMRESFRHKNLALRIMEVRSAYCSLDFEWDNLQMLCNKHMEDSNTNLMREFLVETSDYKE